MCILNLGMKGLTLSLPTVIGFQISPATSPEILHHTVWRTWLSIAYLSMPPILTTSFIHFSSEGRETVLYNLGSKRVNMKTQNEYGNPADLQTFLKVTTANLYR